MMRQQSISRNGKGSTSKSDYTYTFVYQSKKFNLPHIIFLLALKTKEGSVEKAAAALKSLAVENGAPEDLEIIQTREYGNTIMFGIPGTLKRMEDGEFPPPKLPPKPEEPPALEELSP
jgi:hypothetical protein